MTQRLLSVQVIENSQENTLELYRVENGPSGEDPFAKILLPSIRDQKDGICRACQIFPPSVEGCS